MAYTEDQLRALREALATPVLRVKFADREVDYRSVDELKAAIATAEADIAKNNGMPIARQIQVWTQKGF